MEETITSPNFAHSSLFRTSCYYLGHWKSYEKTISVIDPATGETIGTVPNLPREEIRKAIDYAFLEQSKWSKTTGKERGKYLRAWSELMLRNKDDLAKIMTWEQGKPLAESIGEIEYAASYLEWFSEEAKRSYGDIIPTHRNDVRLLSWREPIGVSGFLTPWNFPSSMITRKAGAALAAGCVAISKPSEITPYSALALAVLAQEAGIPPGVFQVVTGFPEHIADEFLENPKMKKISFTGSVRVGKLLLEKAAPKMKRLSLELGGNAPFIVFSDANIQDAVKGAVLSKFRNTGQTCVCANRFLVHEKVISEFSQLLVKEVSKLKVGNGFDEGIQQGPLINEVGFKKVKNHVENAASLGGKILTGGKPHSLGGTFFEPTVILGVPTTALCFQEETFGPVAPICSFRTEEEAIHIANNTNVGLASYIYGRDHALIWRVSESIESGMVSVNEGILSTEQVPFGGVKDSGMGREGSKYGMEEYQELKYICWGGQKKI
ncbi:succinate-semialdehyde dehydrogenase (NADP(+)) [Leptospira perolatii]|uniref:Succinate-semialdehyde dehydrogenase (NADP(+)) n=1 Tax=Leptospira perolatii TaxID=2023191 RepID=A0A2M9ZRM9_9LEPT|nr:NAD-dependent succinate-semialdehyde dehydrogenase [Leptospira perolatii]PJZ71142.1 succinate-semialdehyde dehydrogenase (NADP(+)) [Leptospira perolatii]PJZ74675.1 succinate-semialdehyde dehydrogenase (NADP(+)) [Leptospira perolatii]